MQKINTIIIGAGQSGLSLSFFLKQKGVPHLILEKGEVGEEWRSRRWDNFHLITPNKMTRLPGFEYSGDNPEGFDGKTQVVKFFEDYAKSFEAPLLSKTEVLSVKKSDKNFLTKTTNGDFESENVVVATGSFHKPFIPQISKKLPENILQIHSSEYKSGKNLPEGGVLVVGGGNSGIQIADDLKKDGREVSLSLGRVRIVPRRYRGKDFMEWAEILGILDRKTEETSEEVKNTIPPILFGNEKTVDLRKLAKEGVKLFGRLLDVNDEQFVFDGNALESIEQGEKALSGFKATVDKYIEENKVKVPKEKEEDLLELPQINSDLSLKDIRTIIWATGFVDDWSFLEVPVLDENGAPKHDKGVSAIPGLYFIGLRWLSKYKSFLLCGVFEDAEYLASKMK